MKSAPNRVWHSGDSDGSGVPLEVFRDPKLDLPKTGSEGQCKDARVQIGVWVGHRQTKNLNYCIISWPDCGNYM